MFNNPLNATDPSGYSVWTKLRDKILKPLAVIALSVVTYGAASTWAVGVYGAGCVVSCSLATASIVGNVAGGAVAGLVAGVSSAALSGQSMVDSLRYGVTGAFAGAITGGLGGYLKKAGFNSRIARGLSGGVNGALQRRDGEGFLRGFLAAQLSVNLGFKSFYKNRFANFTINRGREALEGYVIDGKRGAERNVVGGLVNDGVGHLVGATTSYIENGRFKAPAFRNGLYYYDSGSTIRRFGAEAITLGNVVSGPNQLYSGSFEDDSYGQWLDGHERKHYFEQSALAANYLPIQIVSQWGATALNGLGLQGYPFMEYRPFHTSPYGSYVR